MTSVVRSNPAIRDIEELLYNEASFLDGADLDGWINLYTDDGTYWMPVLPDQQDPINHISLFYDDRVLMEIRRRNLKQMMSDATMAERCSLARLSATPCSA